MIWNFRQGRGPWNCWALSSTHMEPGKDKGKSAKADGKEVKRTFFFYTTRKPPGSVVERNCLSSRRHERHKLSPRVRKIPWRRKWQPTPVLLPGKSHGQRSLAGYSPWGHRVGHHWATNTQFHRHPVPPPAAHEPETVVGGCELDPINVSQRLNYSLYLASPPFI